MGAPGRGSPAGSGCPLSLPLLGTLLTGAIVIQAERAPHVVNRIIGETGLLSVMVPRGLQVVDVRWKSDSAKVRLGDSKGGEFVPDNLSYINYSQWIQRLDMYNEATLRIRNLTKSDSGVYKADVQLNDASNNEDLFQLNVYDPVPDPRINKESCKTTEGCTVRLHCQVPDGRDLKYTWYERDSNGSGTYKHIANGRMLNSNTSCLEYLCVVGNPVEEKNVSIVPECPEATPQDNQIYAYLAIPIVIILVAVVAILILCKRKKERQRNHEAVPPDDPQDVRYKTQTEDAVYANGISGAPNGIYQAQSTSENSAESYPEEDPVYLKVY